MTDLFQSLDDLKPFIFRITDNGGASCDRFTIIFCDGDYYGASTNPFNPQGFGMSGEGIDVQAVAERVEEGEERDLRWIDLPERVQTAVMQNLNLGFSHWIESEECAADRDAADDFDGTWRPNETYHPTNPIYRTPEGFAVRDDENGDESFATFREAVLYILPEDYTLSGPEYHTTVDLWDMEGGPAPLWDHEEDEEED